MAECWSGRFGNFLFDFLLLALKLLVSRQILDIVFGLTCFRYFLLILFLLDRQHFKLRLILRFNLSFAFDSLNCYYTKVVILRVNK